MPKNVGVPVKQQLLAKGSLAPFAKESGSHQKLLCIIPLQNHHSSICPAKKTSSSRAIPPCKNLCPNYHRRGRVQHLDPPINLLDLFQSKPCHCREVLVENTAGG